MLICLHDGDLQIALPNCRVLNGKSLVAQYTKISLELRPREMKGVRLLSHRLGATLLVVTLICPGRLLVPQRQSFLEQTACQLVVEVTVLVVLRPFHRIHRYRLRLSCLQRILLHGEVPMCLEVMRSLWFLALFVHLLVRQTTTIDHPVWILSTIENVQLRFLLINIGKQSA